MIIALNAFGFLRVTQGASLRFDGDGRGFGICGYIDCDGYSRLLGTEDASVVDLDGDGSSA